VLQRCLRSPWFTHISVRQRNAVEQFVDIADGFVDELLSFAVLQECVVEEDAGNEKENREELREAAGADDVGMREERHAENWKGWREEDRHGAAQEGRTRSPSYAT